MYLSKMFNPTNYSSSDQFQDTSEREINPDYLTNQLHDMSINQKTYIFAKYSTNIKRWTDDTIDILARLAKNEPKTIIIKWGLKEIPKITGLEGLKGLGLLPLGYDTMYIDRRLPYIRVSNDTNKTITVEEGTLLGECSIVYDV